MLSKYSVGLNFDKYGEVPAQEVAVAEGERFVQEGALQLPIQLLVKLTARIEKRRASQVAVGVELALVEMLEAAHGQPM